MKRSSELESSYIRTLMSTTKQSPEEIYRQGYGDKVGLALCIYRLRPDTLAFDYETMGDLYAKKQEREVLLMPGSSWTVRNAGQDEGFRGKDGLPAQVFEIVVSAPAFDTILQGGVSVREDLVYDPVRLEAVRHLYEEMNGHIGGAFPGLPD